MITQQCRGMNIPLEKGFFITGNSQNDVSNQLNEYCKENPKKWVYYCDCGVKPGKPIPTAEWCLEVSVYDKKPSCLMMFYRLRQEGCEGLEEEVTDEIRKKHLNFFYTLGQSTK